LLSVLLLIRVSGVWKELLTVIDTRVRLLLLIWNLLVYRVSQEGLRVVWIHSNDLIWRLILCFTTIGLRYVVGGGVIDP